MTVPIARSAHWPARWDDGCLTEGPARCNRAAPGRARVQVALFLLHARVRPALPDNQRAARLPSNWGPAMHQLSGGKLLRARPIAAFLIEKSWPDIADVRERMRWEREATHPVPMRSSLMTFSLA